MAQPENLRILRVESEIKLVLANWVMTRFQREFPGILSVTRVQITKDLRQAKAFVSWLSGEDLSEGSEKTFSQIIKEINAEASEAQSLIAKKIHMRYCPKVEFRKDESLQQVLKVEKILNEISKNNSAEQNL